MLDAYTVRKIAPRLLFAVIGVNLSIYLCVAAIDITNVVGHGIAQLIRAPFDIGGALNAELDTGSSNLAGGVVIGVATLGIIASMQGQVLATVGLLLLPVIVIVLLAVLTLVIRQALLVLLTLVSPVAIVLSVLPGTDRFFRQWWDLFWRTLIIYPMIAALFAVSDVLASISFNNSNTAANTAGAVNIIGGIMFTFMPIALVPFTFRMSGGVLGAFSNATGGLRSMANQFAAQGLRKNFATGWNEKVKPAGIFNNPRKRWTGEAQEFDKASYDPNIADYAEDKDGKQWAVDKDGNKMYQVDNDDNILDEHGNKTKRTFRKKDEDGNDMTVTQRSRSFGRKREVPIYEGMEEKGYGFRHRVNRTAGMAANLGQMNLSTSPKKTWNSLVNATDRATARQVTAMAETEEGKALAGYDDEMHVLANYNQRDWHDQLIERVGERFNYKEAGLDKRTETERKKNLDNSIAMMDAYQRKAGGRAARVAAGIELAGISTSYKAKYYLKKDGKDTKEIWDPKKGHKEEERGSVYKSSADQMQETILRATGGQRGLGNWTTAQVIGRVKQAGRYDMGASASAVLLYQEAMRSGDAKAIKGAQEYYEKMVRQRVTPAQATQGHPRAAEEVANAWEGGIDKIVEDMNKMRTSKDPNKDERLKGLQEEYARATATLGGFHDSLASANRDTGDNFGRVLKKDFRGRGTTGFRDMEAMRNAVFKFEENDTKERQLQIRDIVAQLHREYSDPRTAEQAGEAAGRTKALEDSLKDQIGKLQ